MLYWASVVSALVGATLISYAAIAEVDSSGYFRIVGAVVVADLFLVMIQPVVRRMSRAPGAQALYAFDCVVDRPVGHLPSGYTAAADGLSVGCSVSAADFAAGVATAIRTLERGGAKVMRVERRSDAA